MADIETKPTVTISLEEYTELFMKANGTNKHQLIADAIRSLVMAQGKIVEPGSYEEDAHGVQIYNSNRFVKDVLNVLALIDKEEYGHMVSAMTMKEILKKQLDDLKNLKKADEAEVKVAEEEAE